MTDLGDITHVYFILRNIHFARYPTVIEKGLTIRYLFLKNFQVVVVLTKVRAIDIAVKKLRKARETFWIQQMRTASPFGLNDLSTMSLKHRSISKMFMHNFHH